ncbi:MAG: hypothetical protein CMJ50_05160 [Planctomycetaceae bacterium]|jgi:hypothetical protein|nr:hypothetical protein [Planctomycetaceae bacterium]
MYFCPAQKSVDQHTPGYIGTEIAYSQGGYETGIVSRVAPAVEGVLTDAMKTLLRSDVSKK